ncbi:hypothetical protein P3X46_019894 [Hevea brasiliensis]|uniref:Myb/SANT-like domain-containing protein n=1 Tax=Hevea brasiliensis TaxID=3981 RepID=A0ABQ9LM40_HEVBR|nr:hypothetical protein P3X46_019894 [Hevea brasiliensis]
MLWWTDFMDEVLISALLYQQNIGNRVDETFTTQALNQVAIEVLKVKNHIKSLKNNFKECYDIFKHTSGIAWSPITKMLDAKLEEKPSAKKWMCTEISHYNQLLLLYGKDRATGDAAETAKEKARRCIIAKEVNGIKEAIDNVAEVLKEGNFIAKKRNEIVERTRQHVYSKHEVCSELLKIGLDVSIHYKAYDFPTTNVTRVRSFFSCWIMNARNTYCT